MHFLFDAGFMLIYMYFYGRQENLSFSTGSHLNIRRCKGSTNPDGLAYITTLSLIRAVGGTIIIYVFYIAMVQFALMHKSVDYYKYTGINTCISATLL